MEKSNFGDYLVAKPVLLPAHSASMLRTILLPWCTQAGIVRWPLDQTAPYPYLQM